MQNHLRLIISGTLFFISFYINAASTTFTEDQITRIEQYQADANSGLISWADVYEGVAEIFEPHIDGNQDLESVWMWFSGAAKVNRGVGAFSTLIREYTFRQGDLHYGLNAPGFDNAGMQNASNKIAITAVENIIDNAKNEEFDFPTIEEIAITDATEVGKVLFSSSDTDSIFKDNAAWSGTLLFPLLRSDQTGRLIERGIVKDGSMNTVEDFRNVMAAYDSFAVGGEAMFNELIFDTPFDWDSIFKHHNIANVVVTLEEMRKTLDFSDKIVFLLTNYLSQSGSGDLERSFGSFLTSILRKETAAEALDFVHHNRVNRLAGQMYQMLLDQPSDEVTSANRQSILNASFNSLSGSSLLSSDVKLLKNYSESELSELVESSKAFRYATERLSAFIFDTEGNSLNSYQSADLNSEDFSKAYSYDRSHFLLQQVDAWLDDSIFTTRGVLERGLKRAYLDYKTGTDLQTSNLGGYGAGFQIQDGVDTFVFGSAENETIQAKSGMDRIYGDAGDDQLSGGDKPDHIEGGSGNDILYGENDEDTLLGGKGDDTLEGGLDSDTLDGGEGNDTYVFTKDSGHDQIFNFDDDKSDDLGIIKYEDEIVDGSGAIRKSENVNIYYNKEKEIRYILIEDILTIQFEENKKLNG